MTNPDALKALSEIVKLGMNQHIWENFGKDAEWKSSKAKATYDLANEAWLDALKALSPTPKRVKAKAR